jgi:hypothetical protein
MKVSRKVKLNTGTKIVNKFKKFDESENIFVKTKKGKEKNHYLARDAAAPYSPGKL